MEKCMDVFDSIEYQAIKNMYDTRCAERSGVPLINHITEGLEIMQANNCTIAAQRAFCLHPLLQNDADLYAHFEYVVTFCDPVAVALAMEYRNIANQWLSDKVWTTEDDGIGPYTYVTYDHRLPASPLKDVMDMLVADKLQNYKDFIIYHKKTHPRSEELNLYFNVWLKHLGITKDMQIWKDTLGPLDL